MPKTPKDVASAVLRKRSKPGKVKAAREEAVLLQYGGREWDMAGLRDQVIAGYVAEGHRASSIKKLALYVKPEDGKAYFVINGKITGDIAL